MRKIAQCTPGVVELVLIPLRQRLEERQRPRKQGLGSLQVPPYSSFSHCSGGAFQAAESPHLGDKCGRGCLLKGSLTWGAVEGIQGYLGMGECELTVDLGDSFRSWLPRMALATWMWVKWLLLFLPPRRNFSPVFLSCGGRLEGKIGRKDSKRVTPPLTSSQVCLRRPEGKVPQIPREGGSSGKETGSP